jgi:hypothetical protein
MKRQQKIDAELFRCAKVAGQQGQDVTAQVAACFAGFHRDLGGLPEKLLGYWKKTCTASPSVGGRLSDEHIIWLAALSEFLSGDGSAGDGFSREDWDAIFEAVNSEADTLPIETLSSLLSVIVERGMFG